MKRNVVWHDTAEAVFKNEFPAELQDALIRALEKLAAYQDPDLTTTQHGRPLDNSVWKVKAKNEAGQWRVVYVKGYPEAVYVVNAYQKKSPSGGAEEAPKDIKNTRDRLYWAEGKHKVYEAIRAAKEAEAKAKAKHDPEGKGKRGKR
jgi:phage-related protein